MTTPPSRLLVVDGIPATRSGTRGPMFEFKDGNWGTPWRCRPERYYCEPCWLRRGRPVCDGGCNHP